MKSKIKDGLFTSTQVSKLLCMNVQTLREWQRKDYLQLPSTGGWQRYSIADMLVLSAMDYLLDTGLTHEMAATIARFSHPIFSEFTKSNTEDPSILYLLVSVNPNEEPSFETIEDYSKVSEVLMNQGGRGKHYVTRLLIDFKSSYQELFDSLNEHVVYDGPHMYWGSKDDLGQ
ncbi:MerR family transcriptional regulator [Sulfitobacter geojensis]|uniref:MerR family transcriptional regulator n=1 Tax=Sulfitobacter geojensis TaxID=1342299 RepID=UPI0007D9361F|nr:MerR family transcriptional regulator [Sulfitobacter geojensis]OAN86081.1 hypothetical protein A8B74_07495 [Sulfitobacter geojensis]